MAELFRQLYEKSFTCTVYASAQLYGSCNNLINNVVLYDSFKRVTVKRTWKHKNAATREGTKSTAEDTCRLVDSCSKKKKKKITQPFKLVTSFRYVKSRETFSACEATVTRPRFSVAGSLICLHQEVVATWSVDRLPLTSLVPCQDLLRFRAGTCDQGCENYNHLLIETEDGGRYQPLGIWNNLLRCLFLLSGFTQRRRLVRT